MVVNSAYYTYVWSELREKQAKLAKRVGVRGSPRCEAIRTCWIFEGLLLTFNRVNQLLLFPDPRPLVERLGADFFRQAPESAGMYLMRDAEERILYVGKAKNLRKRLCSYRVANPDTLRKRHLKLLRAVARIQLELCDDEKAALAREAELLLALRPRYNRAGTWSSPQQFVAWSVEESGLLFSVTQHVPPGWQFHGPLRTGALSLRAAMVRLAWCAMNQQDVSRLPEGWFGLPRGEVLVSCRNNDLRVFEEMSVQLQSACAGKTNEFVSWLRERTANLTDPFTLQVRDLDLDRLALLNKVAATSTSGPSTTISTR